MSHTRKKHHNHKSVDSGKGKGKAKAKPKNDDVKVKPVQAKDDSSSSIEIVKPHSHKQRSEAYSDSNRFYHSNQQRTQGAVQTTNVTVNIAKDDDKDPVSGCFKSLFKCFK